MTYGPLNGAMVNFNWDARNRLTGVGNTTYLYDSLNNRVSVTETVYGSERETRYIIDSNADLSRTLIITDPDGNQTFYVYGLGLIGEEKDGTYRTYHYDMRGSAVAISDENGSVTGRFEYGPYGELLNHTGATDTPFLYNGRDGVMTDANGLYFMRARYYNPEIKRFLSEDSFEGKYDQLLNINLFEYVNGNPISYIDPTGKWKNKAEQERANKSWSSKDYNEMCKLGFRWGKEPGNRAKIEADANKIRAKNNVPLFGSHKYVLVQETKYWTDEYSLIEDAPEGPYIPPNGDYYSNYQSFESETIGSHKGNQIYGIVPVNYIYRGQREGEVKLNYDFRGVIVWYINYRQNIYYDWGPPKR